MATAPIALTEPTIDFVLTADGDLAARAAHLVFALVPCADGVMRARSVYPARDPATCRRDEFQPSSLRANDEASFRLQVAAFVEDRRQMAALGRTEIRREALKSLDTPWETCDHGLRYADGIMRVMSPGHGGFVLSRERNDAIDPRWRADCDVNAFYEEDEQWAIVAFTFPDFFTDLERMAADATLKDSHPDVWKAITGRGIEDDRA